MRLRLPIAGAVVVLAGALAACGTESPDLFVVTRSGSVPGARLKLLVSDQSIRCNDGAAHELTSKQILEVREINEKLLELQDDDPAVPRTRAQIFRFSVRTEKGTLAFGDTTLHPTVLSRVALFTRRIAQDVCRLQR